MTVTTHPSSNGDPPLPGQRERVHRGRVYPVSPAHPLADLFPWASEDELDAMAAEMRDPGVGQKHPIEMLPDGRIVDGRNRELACRVAGVNPRYMTVRLAEFE